MPMYEYVCSKCNHKFDHLARTMSENGPVKCSACGSNQTKRALSVFAVGAESTKSSAAPARGGCGRCGGPGPCAS